MTERTYGDGVAAELTAHVDTGRDELVRHYLNLVDTHYGRYRIAVVTALEKETAAVEAVLGPGQKLFHEITEIMYRVFEVPSSRDDSPHRIVAVQAPKMGNSSSAIAALSVMKDFRKVRDVVMVGIAGGIPDPNDHERDVRVGDIVVSQGRGLVQYDMVKAEDDRTTVRAVQSAPSAFLSTYIRQMEADRIRTGTAPWERHLEAACRIQHGARPPEDADVMRGKRRYEEDKDLRRRPARPVVHVGVVASANALLKSASRRDELKANFGALAVEMEGSGVGDAAWFSGSDYMIIRGICDYCDDRKNDDWQGYAAGVAAAYLRALLEATPDRRNT